MEITQIKETVIKENHDHAWRGVWNRPMHMNEDKMHAFDVARMTDHNVRGGDLPGDLPGTLPDENAAVYAIWDDEGGGSPLSHR